jgi:hypothetical protein
MGLSMTSSVDVRRSGQFELDGEVYEHITWSHVLHVTAEFATNHTEVLSPDFTRNVQIWLHAREVS